MKKNVLIICVVILFILIAAIWFFLYNQKPIDILKASDSQIVSLLNKNSDAQKYIKNHPDFKIDKKEILTKESIVAGQNGQNFTEVYQGLELQNNRYMRVDLLNQASDRGLIALIDFKTQKTLKAYGLLLLKATQPQIQNGQIPIPTEDK